MADTLKILSELEKKVLWLSSWTIHNANHLRENVDGLKVGGHQASSASLATIMTALYFAVLRPEDRVAVKPHAEPGLPRHPVSARQPDAARSSRISAATRARRAIPRAPRTPTTSTSRPARSASAWRRRCSPRWCRTMCAAHGWDGGPAGGADGRAGRRRRDGRGQHLRGPARRLEARHPQHLVGGRLQPPEPRRGDPRRPVGALRDDVPEFRLGRGDPEIRLAARRPPSRSPAARRCGTGSTTARTSSIRRSPSRAARPGGSGSSTTIGDQGAGLAR